MLRKCLYIILFSILSLISSSSFAQGFPGGGGMFNPADLQDVLGNVDPQQMQQTMMNSMMNSGLDMQKVMGEMQDGSFDPANYQKEFESMQNSMMKFLEDSGVDMNKLQNTVQNSILESLKAQLQPTEQEWAILLPKLKKLVAAMNNAPSSSSNMMMNMGMGMNVQAQTPLKKAETALKNLLVDPKSSNAVISAKLKEYRSACAQALKDLSNTQKDLIEVLSPRQEAILVDLGFMK